MGGSTHGVYELARNENTAMQVKALTRLEHAELSTSIGSWKIAMQVKALYMQN